MDIVTLLREKSREIAPDYPSIQNDLEPWEHLWAITSSYEGTSQANEDCHQFIRYLGAKLGKNTPEEVYAMWEDYKNEQAKSSSS